MRLKFREKMLREKSFPKKSNFEKRKKNVS